MSTLVQRSVLDASGFPLDQIQILGIAARGFHGVLESEREAGQDFSADVTLYLDTRAAARDDDLDETVNYALVAQDVVDILTGAPVDLIETVAEQIAAAILDRPLVASVDVTVHKPQAPIPVPFSDVTVTINRDRLNVPVVASPVAPALDEIPPADRAAEPVALPVEDDAPQPVPGLPAGVEEPAVALTALPAVVPAPADLPEAFEPVALRVDEVDHAPEAEAPQPSANPTLDLPLGVLTAPVAAREADPASYGESELHLESDLVHDGDETSEDSAPESRAGTASAGAPSGLPEVAAVPPLDEAALAEQARLSEEVRRPEVFGLRPRTEVHDRSETNVSPAADPDDEAREVSTGQDVDPAQDVVDETVDVTSSAAAPDEAEVPPAHEGLETDETAPAAGDEPAVDERTVGTTGEEPAAIERPGGRQPSAAFFAAASAAVLNASRERAPLSFEELLNPTAVTAPSEVAASEQDADADAAAAASHRDESSAGEPTQVVPTAPADEDGARDDAADEADQEHGAPTGAAGFVPADEGDADAETAHGEPVHHEAAHEQTAHDETSHDETSHDETEHDEAAHDEAAHDEAEHDEAEHHTAGLDGSSHSSATAEETVVGSAPGDVGTPPSETGDSPRLDETQVMAPVRDEHVSAPVVEQDGDGDVYAPDDEHAEQVTSAASEDDAPYVPEFALAPLAPFTPPTAVVPTEAEQQTVPGWTPEHRADETQTGALDTDEGPAGTDEAPTGTGEAWSDDLGSDRTIGDEHSASRPSVDETAVLEPVVPDVLAPETAVVDTSTSSLVGDPAAHTEHTEHTEHLDRTEDAGDDDSADGKDGHLAADDSSPVEASEPEHTGSGSVPEAPAVDHESAVDQLTTPTAPVPVVTATPGEGLPTDETGAATSAPAGVPSLGLGTQTVAGPFGDLSEPEDAHQMPLQLDRMDARPDEPVDAVLALGANLGDAQGTLRRAVAELGTLTGVDVVEVGPLARTAAVGGPEQPDFLNTVVIVRTTLSPRELMLGCQSVEAGNGRVRDVRWGPRTLDIDIVVYGDVIGSAPDLELPHPRANERAFVLAPWAHLSPDAHLPGLGGGPVAALAATAHDREGIRWLALDWLHDAEVPTAAQVRRPATVAPALTAVQVVSVPQPETDQDVDQEPAGEDSGQRGYLPEPAPAEAAGAVETDPASAEHEDAPDGLPVTSDEGAVPSDEGFGWPGGPPVIEHPELQDDHSPASPDRPV